jgi:hypothetical protein
MTGIVFVVVGILLMICDPHRLVFGAAVTVVGIALLVIDRYNRPPQP